MFANDPHNALVLAHDHERTLRAEAAAERLRNALPVLPVRRSVAAALRRAADRLDPVRLQPRVAR